MTWPSAAPRSTPTPWTGIWPCCRIWVCRFTKIFNGCLNGPRQSPPKSKWPGNGHRTAREWIALQPGARWANKRWPAENFAELVRLLAKDFPDRRFAILGGVEDQPLGEIISRAAPARCLNLCGQTSLPEMVEWLRLCELMVTNDSGPMHAAAALGKPLVALFGPTEPRRTGPYGHLENVLRLDLPCSPCLKSHCVYEKPNECLKAISPAWFSSASKATAIIPSVSALAFSTRTALRSRR